MTQYEQYIEDVTSGKQVSCEYVKLAVQRHLNDLERDDVYFDTEAADSAIRFWKILRHTKGEYQNQFFKLTDWQSFILANVYGWKKTETGNRKYRKVYNEVARKNGKTEFLAGAGLKALIADGEKGAEVYSAATQLSQAALVFKAAKYMGMKLKSDSKKIDELLSLQARNMHVLSTNSMFEPIPADSDKLDGLGASFAAIDEYGAHKTSELLKVLETSQGSRLQPLLWIITTAYFDKQAPCYQFRNVCISVLKGQLEDDSLFAMIFTLDEDDDWTDSKNWIKANPSIGLTPYWDYMNDAYTKAKNEGQVAEIQFKTKNLNIWTNTGSTWIKDDIYMGCLEQFTEEDLLQEECYGGLDLASEGDIAAYVLYFPKSKRFIEYYFCPEAKIEDRKQGDGVDYRQWAHDGFIIPTIGDWIDYRFIQHTILESMKKFVVKEINYDAWGAAKMVQELIEEGAPFFPFRQGYKSMSPPAKELNNLFHKGEIKHNGNPVTRWMMGNVFITYDPTLAIKIDKSKSTEKVDGIVALVMALGGWIENRDDDYYNGIGVGIL